MNKINLSERGYLALIVEAYLNGTHVDLEKVKPYRRMIKRYIEAMTFHGGVVMVHAVFNAGVLATLESTDSFIEKLNEIEDEGERETVSFNSFLL